MIRSFSSCLSGTSISTLSTSETEGKLENASSFRRSSSRLPAVLSAVKPERPELARMRSSQTTDSMPAAWSFSIL
jgi:hypothetical protein